MRLKPFDEIKDRLVEVYKWELGPDIPQQHFAEIMKLHWVEAGSMLASTVVVKLKKTIPNITDVYYEITKSGLEHYLHFLCVDSAGERSEFWVAVMIQEEPAKEEEGDG